MSAAAEAVRLLRLERLRWQTGWANALASPRREDRLRVLRSVLALGVAGSALVWLASGALAAAGSGGGDDPATGAAVASMFCAFLFVDGIRRGREDGAERRVSEEWMVAVGVPVPARAARDTAASLLAAVPYAWIPVLGLAGLAPGIGASHRVLLLLPGLAASVLGFGMGSVLRVLPRRAVAIALGAVSLLVAVALGDVAAFAADPGWARSRGLEALARGPWPALLGPRGPLLLPLLAVAAVVLGGAGRTYGLGRLGWAPFDAAGPRVRRGKHVAVVASGSLGRTLFRREGARLGEGLRREALPIAVVAAGTLAAYWVKSLGAGPGFVAGASLAWTVGFATLLPAIMLVEIAWADEDPESRAYLRAVSAAEDRACHLRLGVAILALAAWQLLVSGVVVGLTRSLALGAGHALLAAGAGAAALSLGAAASALALRAGAGATGGGRLLRYAATAAGAWLGPVTLMRSGSPALAAAVCVLCLAGSAPLAAAWTRRAEIYPAPPS